MAQRRMFSLRIVDTDAFLDMPLSAQALYFHLGLQAKDKGILYDVWHFARAIGCTQEDVHLLFDKGYLHQAGKTTYKITHWYENNGIGETAKKRNNYEYRQWRASIIERDGKCLMCGSENNLVAHHIKPYAEYPLLRHDLDNGMTLCSECHLNLHKEMRRCRKLSGLK